MGSWLIVAAIMGVQIAVTIAMVPDKPMFTVIAGLFFIAALLLSPRRSFARLFAATPTVWHIVVCVYPVMANVWVLREHFDLTERFLITVTVVGQALLLLALAYRLFAWTGFLRRDKD